MLSSKNHGIKFESLVFCAIPMVHEYFERVIPQKPKNSFGDCKTNMARDVVIYLAWKLTDENERNLSVYFGDIVDAGILCGISK